VEVEVDKIIAVQPLGDGRARLLDRGEQAGGPAVIAGHGLVQAEAGPVAEQIQRRGQQPVPWPLRPLPGVPARPDLACPALALVGQADTGRLRELAQDRLGVPAGRAGEIGHGQRLPAVQGEGDPGE
jgi:hypothetical protein